MTSALHCLVGEARGKKRERFAGEKKRFIYLFSAK
jgi:hypothetical protein